MYKEICLWLLLSGFISSQIRTDALSQEETFVTGGQTFPVPVFSWSTSAGTSANKPTNTAEASSAPAPLFTTGPVFSQNTTEAGSTDTPIKATEASSAPIPLLTTEARQQIAHIFSEPEITAIVFGVMAVIVGIILSVAHGVRLLRRKTSHESKSQSSVDTGATLHSVETGNPE
ncbi:glycophorin-A isoform X2 [Loxodonta africana]|uniref:glycophorin-A isoform X2 n=1 Tax=Loxodonta africana TaxID=9785 RepID=UPI000C81223A|nr:glycophorin-A isoform X2 [Loxodonta africana]